MSTSRNRQTKTKKTVKIKSDAPLPRIKPGIYEAVCYDAVIKPGYYGPPTCYVNFRMFGGEHDGVELFMCCPANHRRLRNRHKLYKQWALAIGRQPNGNEPFEPEVFCNKLYRVKVRYTKSLHPDSCDSMPDHIQYSVVDTIIEPLTGVEMRK